MKMKNMVITIALLSGIIPATVHASRVIETTKLSCIQKDRFVGWPMKVELAQKASGELVVHYEQNVDRHTYLASQLNPITVFGKQLDIYLAKDVDGSDAGFLMIYSTGEKVWADAKTAKETPMKCDAPADHSEEQAPQEPQAEQTTYKTAVTCQGRDGDKGYEAGLVRTFNSRASAYNLVVVKHENGASVKIFDSAVESIKKSSKKESIYQADGASLLRGSAILEPTARLSMKSESISNLRMKCYNDNDISFDSSVTPNY